jgi:crotonobetainyl-CoA:carnitine CoA-transferase CaiB-like acyl-CoA transferase
VSKLPLEGIRVLDSTYVYALPYAGGQLSDLGADVIKIEGPGRPDVTRLGVLSGSVADNENKEDWWNRSGNYNLLNRGKRSLVLDMTDDRGRDLFRQLVSISDVVMENFTPRVMRGWKLDYSNLRKIRPDVIMVSNTGYGHGDGPYSSYPAQATSQEATHGHCWITGYRDGAPSKVGNSFVDFPAGLSALFAIGAALRYRNRTGHGQWIDLAMYQTGVMLTSEYLMDAIANGRNGGRIGNRHPYRAPQGCYPSLGKDQWITLSVGSDMQWTSLCELMNQGELATDSQFGDVLSRQRNHDRIDEIINLWTEGKDKYELTHLLQAVGIPAGPVLSGKDVHFDPQYRSRGFLESITYPKWRQIGTRSFMGRPYKFSGSPMQIRWPAPAFGQDNESIVSGLLGVDKATYQLLVKDTVIGSAPTRGEPAVEVLQEQAVALGLLADWDPDYLKRLEIS